MSARDARKTWMEGSVHWFDPHSGEGMIRSEDGNLFYVHSSAIEEFVKAKSDKHAALKDNQR